MDATLLDETSLVLRARALAGRRVDDVAAQVGAVMPAGLVRTKGFVGTLLEQALGAYAGSRPVPDFTSIGVELKALPVDAQGRVLESTFVCTAAPRPLVTETWATSRAREKLARVLFVPVEADRTTPLSTRRIGAAFLWSPDVADEALLRRDWEDLADLVARGLADHVSARRGVVLQLRPKAPNAAQRRDGVDEEGDAYRARPLGFYLRSKFTASILRRHVVVSG